MVKLVSARREKEDRKVNSRSYWAAMEGSVTERRMRYCGGGECGGGEQASQGLVKGEPQEGEVVLFAFFTYVRSRRAFRVALDLPPAPPRYPFPRSSPY